MNVPKLRFKCFQDEWKNIDLSKCFEYFSTNSLSRDSLSNEGVIKNVHYGDIHRKLNSIVDANDDIDTYIKDINYINKNELLKENDLIFADASEDYEGIGKSIEIINVGNNNIVAGLHTILARETNKYFSPKFKGYYFNSPVIHNQIRVLANGFKVYGISKTTINSINAKIPNLSEQEKISNTLYLLDKKIELQSKKVEALKLYKKGLILNLRKDKDTWSSHKVNDLFNITRGIVIPKNELSEIQTNEYCYPVYSSQTSNDGILGYDKNYDFDGKYLTWTTDGANAGKVFFRNGKFRCTNVCGVLYENKIKYTNEMICELLNLETPKYVSYVGNPKLMNNVMGNITLYIPNNDIQSNVSNILHSLKNKLNFEEIKLTKLQELKKGLMQNMFV